MITQLPSKYVQRSGRVQFCPKRCSAVCSDSASRPDSLRIEIASSSREASKIGTAEGPVVAALESHLETCNTSTTGRSRCTRRAATVAVHKALRIAQRALQRLCGKIDHAGNLCPGRQSQLADKPICQQPRCNAYRGRCSDLLTTAAATHRWPQCRHAFQCYSNSSTG